MTTSRNFVHRVGRLHVTAAFVVVSMSFVSASRAAGQGCCSIAPQAGPGSVSGQGVGSLYPWQGWIHASVSSLSTSEQFGVTGVEEAYFNEGHLDVQSFLLTGAMGLVTGLELWGQGTLHSLRYRDAASSQRRAGLGDVRVWLRAGPSFLGANEADIPFWLGVRAGLKFPGSNFPVDARILPLSEGQKDAEIALEVGRTFGDGRFAVQGWAGHRWRGRNELIRVKPGNEWFAYASVGGPLGPVQLRLSIQALDGSPYETFGIRLPTSRREMVGLFPTLATRFGPGSFEVGAQLPVAGRNLPTGVAFMIGYTFSFGEPPLPSLEDLFPS